MFHVLEMKQAFFTVHIDLSAIVNIMKTLLLLAPPKLIKNTDWPTQEIWHTPQKDLTYQFREELKCSTDQFGTKFAGITFQRQMQKCFANLLVFLLINSKLYLHILLKANLILN